MQYEPLVSQYRGNCIECIHFGKIVAIDEHDHVSSVGGAEDYTFYRSASKPIQSLPVLLHGLDKEYGLSDQEIAIMSGSHWAEDIHVQTLTSIMEKTGLREEDMVMLPAYPRNQECKQRLIARGMPPRKIYHNCSGKHLAMMLLTRKLHYPVETYWTMEGAANKEIMEITSALSGIPVGEIRLGVDGCGVPVYAVPFYAIARSFLRLVCTDCIQDPTLRAAAARNLSCIHKYPVMLDGAGQTCAAFCSTGDMLSKAGALGVYPVGIRSLRLAFAVKISDGNDIKASFAAMEAVRQLGYDPSATIWETLKQAHPDAIYNDNAVLVGHQECVFHLDRPR